MFLNWFFVLNAQEKKNYFLLQKIQLYNNQRFGSVFVITIIYGFEQKLFRKNEKKKPYLYFMS